MNHYIFKIDQSNRQYLQIELRTKSTGTETFIQLPAWRPGRYELGNFAKNVKGFKVYDSKNKSLVCTKITKDKWKVETHVEDDIRICYAYYAAELNAGSTFLSPQQLYVNPVNCSVYVEGREQDPITAQLEIPEDWKIAVALKKEGKVLEAKNFDEWADSPFICSSELKYNQYEANGTLFHVWINGMQNPDWPRLIKDFKAFTDKQIEKFGEFPVPEYHFLIQILPIKAYHGVEHSKSTVIALGPTHSIFTSLYKELLGVSSHELYHTWNVKAIRPIEMFPYDFTKENYSRLGYICEGITTYMGDLFLLKSNVFDLKAYLDELKVQLQKHFDNPGRFNLSVGDSSYDTWLDGYVPGAPGRKVSIYTEGCLLAFATDLRLLRETNYKFGLDEVMKRLYFNYAVQNKGVSEEDYKRELENLSGSSWDNFFKSFINGTEPYESLITEAFELLGLELKHKPATTYSAARLGFKAMQNGSSSIIKAMYPGGPAELGGLMLEDEIIALNGHMLNGELENWLHHFDNDLKTFTINRGGLLKELTLPEVNRNFYSEYWIEEVKEPNGPQKKAMKAWSN